MNIETYRSQASKWIPAASASSYERYGSNVYNFNVSDSNLRLWILGELARKSVDVPPQDVYWLRDVFILPNTLIYSAYGTPLAVSLPDQVEAPDLAREAMDAAKVVEFPVAFIFKAGKDNYGHVLIEMLPKLRHLLAIGVTPIKLVLPIVPKEIAHLIGYVLETMFPDAFKIVSFGNEILRVREVVVPGPIAKHNWQKSAVIAAFGEAVRHRFADGSASADSIYVSRMGIRNRSMINEAEIERVMQDAGFDIVRPETMNFSDQVSVFSSARRIVGPLGAGLSNILFSRDGAEILMIDPGMYDLFFYDLACLRKHSFHWLFTEKIDFTRASRLHRDYEVDLSLVREVVKSIWG